MLGGLLRALDFRIGLIRLLQQKTTDRHISDLAISCEIIVSTVTGIVLNVDDKFCKLTGWRASDLVGEPLDVLLPKVYGGRQIKSRHLDMIRKGLLDKTSREMTKNRAPIPILTPDGKEMPASIVIDYRQKDATEWLGIAIITFKDLSDRPPVRRRPTVAKQVRDVFTLLAVFIVGLSIALAFVEIAKRVIGG